MAVTQGLARSGFHHESVSSVGEQLRDAGCGGEDGRQAPAPSVGDGDRETLLQRRQDLAIRFVVLSRQLRVCDERTHVHVRIADEEAQQALRAQHLGIDQTPELGAARTERIPCLQQHADALPKRIGAEEQETQPIALAARTGPRCREPESDDRERLLGPPVREELARAGVAVHEDQIGQSFFLAVAPNRHGGRPPQVDSPRGALAIDDLEHGVVRRAAADQNPRPAGAIALRRCHEVFQGEARLRDHDPWAGVRNLRSAGRRFGSRSARAAPHRRGLRPSSNSSGPTAHTHGPPA
jgi:hypothetical protein